MFLGIGTYTFPWAMSIHGNDGSVMTGALQLLQYACSRKIGFVQFGDNLPLHFLPDSGLKEIKGTADRSGIAIETGARGLTIENIQRYLQIATIVGSPFLRMVIDDDDYHPGQEEVTGIIKEALPLLRKSNIILAIENHDRFPGVTLREIILATDPAFVGVCLDTANSIGAGEGMNEVLEVLAPYTVNLHIKDIIIKRADHKMGFMVEGVAAGDGIMNIPAIIHQLERRGRCRTAVLEQWSNPGKTMEKTIIREQELVEKSIHYLQNILT